MPKNKTEVPGNVLATQANIERIVSFTGQAVHKADYRVSDINPQRLNIKQFKIKAPPGGQGMWMGVVTAIIDDVAVVGFHQGETFGRCLEGLCSRIANGSLNWRHDEYA